MSTHTVRVAIAVAAAFLCSLMAADFALAHSDRQLLKRYQPVTRFDPVEQFQPTTVRSFVRDSDLERLESGSWVLVDADPRLRELPDLGTGVWRLNQDTCSPTLELGGLSCYAAAAGEGPARSVVYARVARPAGAVVLQYWYFYYDNTYSYAYPPSNFIWQAHEGDWEVVNVVLSEDEEPEYVGYSQHCLGQRRAWSLTEKLGRHPIVHVAAGSHANYLSAGVHPIHIACIPPAAIAFLQANGLPLPVDRALAGGDVAGPRMASGTVTHVRRVNESHPSWISFDGFWGELQYFHAPAPIGTVALGTSPKGPVDHAVWTNPIGTIAGWPAG